MIIKKFLFDLLVSLKKFSLPAIAIEKIVLNHKFDL